MSYTLQFKINEDHVDDEEESNHFHVKQPRDFHDRPFKEGRRGLDHDAGVRGSAKQHQYEATAPANLAAQTPGRADSTAGNAAAGLGDASDGFAAAAQSAWHHKVLELQVLRLPLGGNASRRHNDDVQLSNRRR